jgi:hypothetical protein
LNGGREKAERRQAASSRWSARCGKAETDASFPSRGFYEHLAGDIDLVLLSRFEGIERDRNYRELLFADFGMLPGLGVARELGMVLDELMRFARIDVAVVDADNAARFCIVGYMR